MQKEPNSDDFRSKIKNIQNKIDKNKSININKAILEEFSSWEKMAWFILKMKTWDCIRYSNMSYRCGDKSAGLIELESTNIYKDIIILESQFNKIVR